MGGDHGHGHGHGRPYEIPDWRKYKVEDVPELVQVQRLLAQKGLKSPWLRNDVWRYDKGWGGSLYSRMGTFAFRGFKWGFIAFALTIVYDKMFKSKDQHHHAVEHGHH